MMRCSLNLLVAGIILAGCVPGLAQAQTYKLGTPLNEKEIQSLGLIVGPQGKELPPGSGTADEGAKVYAKRCAVCHGPNGEGGINMRLVPENASNTRHGFVDKAPTDLRYYPYATTAWDYIARAMPLDSPGSLNANEVYALTAYLLFRNGIIPESETLDAKSLPKIKMPNRDGFVPAAPTWPIVPRKPSWW